MSAALSSEPALLGATARAGRRSGAAIPLVAAGGGRRARGRRGRGLASCGCARKRCPSRLSRARRPPLVASARSSAWRRAPSALQTRERRRARQLRRAAACRSAPTMVVPATELANYVVAHSDFSSPVRRRNLLSALMVSEPGTSGTPAEVGAANPRRARQCDPESAVASASAGCALAPGASPAWPAPMSPRKWLERMNHALTTRNYDGSFSHWRAARSRCCASSTASQDGAVSERLVSLDGSGPRVHPHRRQPRLLSARQARRAGGAAAPAESRCSAASRRSTTRPRASTTSQEVARMRFIGATRTLITVDAAGRVPLRLSLWIDESTAMPLKTQLLRHARPRDRADRIRESHAAARTSPTRRSNPRSRPTGFQWLRNDSAPLKRAGADAAIVWSALQLPPGFHMTVRAAQIDARLDRSRSTIWCSPMAWPPCRCSSRRTSQTTRQVRRVIGVGPRGLLVGLLHGDRRPQGHRGR